MRALSSSFATDPTLVETYLPVLLPSAEDFTPAAIDVQARGRDGVILLMSYVMHQDMIDGRVFKHIVRTLSDTRLPVWIIAQDANRPQLDEANVEVWPETRLRAMLNATEAFGYRFRLGHKRFEARKFVLDELGNATEQPCEGRYRARAVAARSV